MQTEGGAMWLLAEGVRDVAVSEDRGELLEGQQAILQHPATAALNGVSGEHQVAVSGSCLKEDLKAAKDGLNGGVD